MLQLYIGNLPKGTNRNSIRKLFSDFEIPYTNVKIHGSYGFVNVPDQLSLDKAVGELNRYDFSGTMLVVEPAHTKIQNQDKSEHSFANRTKNLTNAHSIQYSVHYKRMQNPAHSVCFLDPTIAATSRNLCNPISSEQKTHAVPSKKIQDPNYSNRYYLDQALPTSVKYLSSSDSNERKSRSVFTKKIIYPHQVDRSSMFQREKKICSSFPHNLTGRNDKKITKSYSDTASSISSDNSSDIKSPLKRMKIFDPASNIESRNQEK